MKMLMESLSLQGPSDVFLPCFYMSILLKIFACMQRNQLINMGVVKIDLIIFFFKHESLLAHYVTELSLHFCSLSHS